MGETQSPDHNKPEGERWLELLGYERLKGQPTGHVIDGRSIPIEEFDLLCGEKGRAQARDLFSKLESLDPNDPQYGILQSIARKGFQKYLGTEVTEA